MDDEQIPGPGGRRATDGLNWRARAPEPPPPQPPAPVAPANAGSGASTFRSLVVALMGGIVGGAVTAAVLVRVLDEPSTTVIDDTQAGPGGTLTLEQTSAITEAATKARPGVVRIESTRRSINGTTEQDIGSGFVFDTNGHILTNAHVVLGTETLKVILPDGSERNAILVGTDHPFTDIAVLQVGPMNITPLSFGDSSRLQLGETVIAIGNPLAEFDGSVTVGVVSGLDRKRTFDGVIQNDVIQTDAAVNSGNSGGVLINLQGQVVGIPTAILRQSRSGGVVEGIAFALPSKRVEAIARRIASDGESYPRPTLGNDAQDLTPEMVRQMRLTVSEGALVTSVAPGSPAAAAGILQGDVITAIGDQPVTRENLFLNAISHYEPGESVRVVLNRNGRIIETDVRLAKRT